MLIIVGGCCAMEGWLETALERYEALIRNDLELDRQLVQIKAKKKRNKNDIAEVRRYLRGGFNDPAVKEDVERIGRLRKELAARNNGSPRGGQNKTHVVLSILQKHAQSGLDLSEIMNWLATYNLEINRNYVGTILSNLQKKRRMVARQGEKYFLTETGRTFRIDTIAEG